MTKRFLLKLHLYLSLPLGVVIMLICLSGATLVFKNEIRNALEMPKVIAPHAKSIKGDHKIKAGDEERVGKTIGKFSSKDAPYGTTTKRDFFSYVTKFHTSLMMGPVGKLIITYTTLLFIFILITGIFVLLPKDRKQLCQRFKVEWNKGSRRRLFDLHVSLGWCALLWLLLLSVTGLGFGLKLVPKGSELMQLFHVIHIGSWGGMLTKIITFVISLIGASLPVTGYLLYFRRKYKS